jgi:hypothetical protein
MDLSNLDTADLANQGAVMELRGPNGAPVLQDDETPVSLSLLGADSNALVRLSNAQTNAYLKQGQLKVTAEGAKANELDYLAKATAGWSGIKVDGKDLDCTEENAKALYRRFPWIADQARAFIADRAHFMKASPTT